MNPGPVHPPTNFAGFRRNVRWNQSGISTSAERHLPFLHRFHSQPQSARLPNDIASAPPLPNVKPLPIPKVMSNSETNPVGALQERFQSRGVAPEFDLIQSEGASHCPIFTYKVTIYDKSTVGSGNSKKQAKHAAAKAMLNLLDNASAPQSSAVNTSSPVLAEEPSTQQQPTSVPSEAKPAEQAGSNPIGELQELCVKSGIPIPLYDLGSVDGQPHKRQFVMVAKVGAVQTTGMGTSKKEAKKRAARAMLDKLAQAGSDAAKSIVFSGGSVAKNGVDDDADDDLDFADLKVEPMVPKQSKSMQQFFENLDQQGTRLQNLHLTPLANRSCNYVTMLAMLSTEQRFESRFIEIEEKTLAGECQCLLQLLTVPVTVCLGHGQDQASAKNDAARNALYYLKAMTNKSALTLSSSASSRAPASKK